MLLLGAAADALSPQVIYISTVRRLASTPNSSTYRLAKRTENMTTGLASCRA